MLLDGHMVCGAANSEFTIISLTAFDRAANVDEDGVLTLEDIKGDFDYMFVVDIIRR